MDPITHMLTGGLVAQNVCKKNFIRQATFIGILSAASPDLDFFVHSDINPLLNLEIHRSFTHSFIFIPVGGLILTLFFLLIFKPWRPRWKEVFGLSTIAYATHSLLDACTSYGTQLFWPFSSARISWDILPIVEPLFTTIMFLGVIITYHMSPKIKSKAQIINEEMKKISNEDIRKNEQFQLAKNISHCSLIAAFLYIMLAVFQHDRAMNIQEELIVLRHHSTTTQNRVLPRFGTIYRWDSLYVYRDQVYLDTIHNRLLEVPYANDSFTTPLFNPNMSSIPPSSLSSVETFIWFAQDYTTAISYNPLILADLRYVQKIPQHPRALWGISWNFNQANPMKQQRLIPLDIQKN